MKIEGKKFNSLIHTLTEISSQSVMLHRHACALVMGGKIVATGVNTFVRKPIHAEMNAIERFLKVNHKACNRCFLIVIRVSNDGSVHESKPCLECVRQIHRHNIKKVCYSSNDGFKVVKGSQLENNHKTLYYYLKDTNQLLK